MVSSSSLDVVTAKFDLEGVDLFSDAQFDWHNYADARPKYPEELFDALFQYHRAHDGKFDLACDFGTGPGIILPPLLGLFKQIYASDLNGHQLDVLRASFADEVASKRVLVEQNEAGKETSLVQDGSADLFVAATAVHWFDRPAWYQLAAKKLKSGGTLCHFSYQGKPYIFTHPEANVALTKMYDYFVAPLFQTEGNKPGFLSSVIDFTVLHKSFENPPSALFDQFERHFWQFVSPSGWTYPHKEWLEDVMGINPFDGIHDKIPPDTKAVDHLSATYGGKTPMAHEDWTSDHLIAYYVSLGARPNFDMNDEEFKSLRKELNDALGGAEHSFGVSWQFSMILSKKK